MNVLISGEHRALLTDFGLSIVMNEIRNLSTYSNDMQGKPRGTMAWMAPEVHRGSRPDKASDIYSLGMTIWEVSAILVVVLSGVNLDLRRFIAIRHLLVGQGLKC